MKESQLENNLESNLFSLSECVQKNTQISEFLESVSLVGSSILGLFASKSLTEIACDSLKVGVLSDVSRNIILSHSKKTSCDELLTYLEKAAPEGFSNIPIDFFNQISRSFTRSHSIENYSRLLLVLFRIYGMQNSFIRNFFSISRDFEESNMLLNHIQKWDFSKFNFTFEEVANRVFLSLLDKLSITNCFDDMIKTLRLKLTMTTSQDTPETIKSFNKSTQHLMINVIQKKNIQKVAEIIELLKTNSFKLSLSTFNKMIDCINKNLQNEELVDSIMTLIKSNGLKPNIITYNCYIENLVLKGKLDQAFDVIETIKREGIEPDSYTFSVMVKGLRLCDRIKQLDAHQQLLILFSNSIARDKINLNSFMDHCILSGDDKTAVKIFEEFKSGKFGLEPDNITYNIYMKYIVKTKSIQDCKSLMEEFKRLNFKPNLSTFNSLLNMVLKYHSYKDLLEFFMMTEDFKMKPDSYSFSIILNGSKTYKLNKEEVRKLIEVIKTSMDQNSQKIDEVVFNSILELLFQNELLEMFDYFSVQMKKQNVPESSFIFSIILKKLKSGEDFSKISDLLEDTLTKKVPISDFNYGFILDYFAKSQQMDRALIIFNKLRKHKVELSSIIFTTMIKGFINSNDCKTALDIFHEVKNATEQPGMIITYNCALDVLILESRMDEAVVLFTEINSKFKADLISYSTMVKGFCKVGDRVKAIEYIQQMLDRKVDYDVSIINLFLENCASSDDLKLGVSSFESLHSKKVVFNDITMGIMVKIYGAAYKLKSAFDLLSIIEEYNLTPTLIFFTNLIHVSFYNKKPVKAELAVSLMKKHKIAGDKLMYSKLIEGLLRFKQTERVLEYVQMAIKDNSTLKHELIDKLFEIYEDEPEACQLIERVKYSAKPVQPEMQKEKLKNKFHVTNTQFFKNQIWQKNREKQEGIKKETEPKKETPCPENPGRGGFEPAKKLEDKNNDFTFKKPNSNYNNSNTFQTNKPNSTTAKQPLILHNFRTNKKGE